MKFVFTSLCLLFFVIVTKADTFVLKSVSYQTGYVLQHESGEIYQGFCLDKGIYTPFESPLSYSVVKLADLVNSSDFSVYKKISGLYNYWLNNRQEGQGIQEAVWHLTNPSTSLSTEYYKYLEMSLVYDLNHYIVFPSNGQIAQRYLFGKLTSEVPEPYTLILLGCGLLMVRFILKDGRTSITNT